MTPSSENDVHPPHESERGGAVPVPGPLGRVLVPLSLTAIVIALVAVTLLLGIWPRQRALAALATAAQDGAKSLRRVTFVAALAGPAEVTMVLPGRLEAAREVAIFPRESGYIDRFQFDVGDTVEQGATLATLRTPVLDSQIQIAESAIAVGEARLGEARAKLDLSRVVLARLTSVSDARAVTAQVLDEAKGRVDADAASLVFAQASLDAARADRERVLQQKSQTVLLAPFAGEVSQRNFDVGALVVADKSDTGRPLFRLVDRSSIRVFVEVPQSMAGSLRVDQEVIVTIKEIAGHSFAGRVVRLGPSIDPVTRTRLLEARLENAARQLLPGMFASVTVVTPREVRPTSIPGEAVITLGGKPRIAIIDAGGAIRNRPITIIRDLGSVVEISDGAVPGDRVVVNLAEDLPEGMLVDPVDRSAPAAK
jgi:RND family efflux transporter MFP subunit